MNARKSSFIAYVISIVLLLGACGGVPDVVQSIVNRDTGTPFYDNIDIIATYDTDYFVDEMFEMSEGTGGVDSNRGGRNGIQPIIEISEDRIFIADNKITLESLHEILLEYGDLEYIWELRDIYQASQAVYSAVIELLLKHNIEFLEGE